MLVYTLLGASSNEWQRCWKWNTWIYLSHCRNTCWSLNGVRCRVPGNVLTHVFPAQRRYPQRGEPSSSRPQLGVDIWISVKINVEFIRIREGLYVNDTCPRFCKCCHLCIFLFWVDLKLARFDGSWRLRFPCHIFHLCIVESSICPFSAMMKGLIAIAVGRLHHTSI